MKKMMLDMASLRVETFDTANTPKASGTVHGHAYSDCCTASCTGTCGAQMISDTELKALAVAVTYPKCMDTYAPACCI
jgi:hypothetical protein